MGHKLTVVVQNYYDKTLEKYISFRAYEGESWLKAFWIMWQYRNSGTGVVYLEWR